MVPKSEKPQVFLIQVIPINQVFFFFFVFLISVKETRRHFFLVTESVGICIKNDIVSGG